MSYKLLEACLYGKSLYALDIFNAKCFPIQKYFNNS